MTSRQGGTGGDQTERGHLRVASSFVGFERACPPLLYDAGL